MEIPRGYHVHSNRPLEKFLIATNLEVEAPRGIRVGRVAYPRALLRKLKFSKNNVAVYEGRVVMRFGVAVPGNYATGSHEIRAKVRYQSCDDEVCFPPQTKETKLWLNVE
jgi:DsbC/DsbD-like thiol-disulfide interchange protein